jgi:hypothetical protein
MQPVFLLAVVLSLGTPPGVHTAELIQAPRSLPRFDVAEFVVKVAVAPLKNPFTDAELSGAFTLPDGTTIEVPGFADSQDGSVFRLRFCPQAEKMGTGTLLDGVSPRSSHIGSEPVPIVSAAGATYRYELTLRGGGLKKEFRGELACTPSDRPGPVIVDPKHPKHFIYAGSKKPFYHLGYTAYHLLDPSNSLADIDATIDYCAEHGFNKVRFLLTGYPRDFDRRTSKDVEHGVPDPWKAPNYGSKPGRVNPLPAWLGKPHAYDFTRFNVAYWQRVDHAVRRMRVRGIVATCIFTIEKQDLPKEYGRLSEHEYRLYRYAVARLAAFDNVWWDLGNEHNEFRNKAWGDTMGAFVKRNDPFGRLASAHAYADFWYTKSPWADFIITQQYGDEKKVHDWALQFLGTPKPYVNEEYGYEGSFDKPGHGQNADWVRRCHWSIAMAGGYATYGDWSGGVSYFYMGEPGPGKAAAQLKHIRSFFESLPFNELAPHDELTSAGFCLAKPPEHCVFYFPRGGKAEVRLKEGEAGTWTARWYDPRTGQWQAGPAMKGGVSSAAAPDGRDWVLLVQRR